MAAVAAAGVGEAVAICSALSAEVRGAAEGASLILCIGKIVPLNGRITSTVDEAASVATTEDAAVAALCCAALN